MNVFDILREKLTEGANVDIGHHFSVEHNVAIRTADAIEIVNQVEKEYNNGWIPYESENMPNQEMLVDCTIMRLSDNHIWVQNLIYCPYERHKWKWTDYPNDIYVDDKRFKVLAWQPLPAPFREDNISRKQTNADRIRSMTDEELAEILIFYNCGVWCTNVSDITYKNKDYAIENVIEFLQSEVEEE